MFDVVIIIIIIVITVMVVTIIVALNFNEVLSPLLSFFRLNNSIIFPYFHYNYHKSNLSILTIIIILITNSLTIVCLSADVNFYSIKDNDKNLYHLLYNACCIY